ncbi:MAG: transglycosylase domain-containing protein [Gordonia sp. (in: high G+C Gram-positive bacteria)]
MSGSRGDHTYPVGVSVAKKLGPLAAACVLAGVLVAGLLYPVASGVGLVSNRAASAVENVSSELLGGTLPEVTTVTDADGNVIATLFDQYRFQVGYNDISPDMIAAIISIEDRRFLEHDGVDWRGTIRAALRNSSSGEVQQGASTLDQQYIKNYQLLVLARTEAEREAATETTPARKLREVRMALTLEESLTDQARRRGLSDAAAKQEAKKQIVTRYLNVVPFGNNAYGIEAAARVYFHSHAKDLTVDQSALLAGIVNASSALNPYTNPEGALERRNTVLDSMIASMPDRRDQIVAAKRKPLGVVANPTIPTEGCIGAGNVGFFCDYALQFLAENGISRDVVRRGGFLIKTTLDPEVQRSVQRATQSQADPDADGVANVMSVIRPGSSGHPVLGMASSRNYGLNSNRNQTVQPQPYSLVGDGAGSVFKVFTVAAALEQGRIGIGSNIAVPSYITVYGMGNSGGAYGCPANAYCVKNDGRYPAQMSVTNALAQSPNTAFVGLLQQVGVKPTVDMAVRLGLRSYNSPGTSGQGNKSMAQWVKDGNFGSFTLGPLPVNGVELSNVAATLASGGVWCPPNPIAQITTVRRDENANPVPGPNGRPMTAEVPFNPPACERVVERGLANSLANAMSQDDRGGGTSAAAAGAIGWGLPSAGKTGTTEAHRSSAFLGFTNTLAGATYVYSDGSNPMGICTAPLRSCYEGNVYGGYEPARTWYSAMLPIATKFGPVALPPTDPQFVTGTDRGRIPQVVGLTASAATARLQAAGFKVSQLDIDSAKPQGTVVATAPSDSALPGSTITIYVSNGRRGADQDGGSGPTQTTVQVPGVGPVVIDLPG